MADILRDLEYLALGSRLKRLAERLQADANLIHDSFACSTQSGHFPLLAALDSRNELLVSEAASLLKARQPAITRTASALVKLGLLNIITPKNDRRQRRLSLTPRGKVYVSQMKREMWPRVATAARDMCGGTNARLLAEVEKLEAAFDERSLFERARNPFRLVHYRRELSAAFYEINAEWIKTMFVLEAHDEKVLKDPHTHIIDKGGEVLFVESIESGEIVATCALMRESNGAIELTKMGVKRSARGNKIGEYLLREAIKKGESLDAAPLFLLTNKKCAPAIHLYEKLGFVHDDTIMKDYGARYERCDVAMIYKSTP